MSNGNNVQPQLNLLTPEQIEQVHRYAINILSTTGVRIDSPSIRQLLRRKVGPGIAQEEIVRMPAELVEWALSKAPSTVNIYTRRGELAFRLGADRLRFPAAVRVGARVRGGGELLLVEEVKGGAVQATVRVTVEIEGSDRPGCVVETISRFIPAKV